MKPRGRKREAEIWVRAIMDSVYEKYDYPNQTKYEEAVAAYRNQTENIPEPYELTKNNVHSQVGRAIEHLIQSGEMFSPKDKVYIPNTSKGRKKYSQILIRDNIKIRSSEVLLVSDLMFAIAIDENQLKENGEMVRKYFMDLIGEDRCFSIAILTDILLITFRPFDTKDEETEFFDDIGNFINSAYDYQEIKQKEETKKREKEERKQRSKAFIEQRTKEKKHYPKIP
jgi:hypothetical protein